MISQLTICRLSAIQDRDNKSTWSYVGSDLGFQQLQDMLKWSRVYVRIERICPEYLSQTCSAQYIVDQFYGQSPAVLKALSKYQFEGSLVLSRLAWCEMVLQRFPPEILSKGDVLEGRFSIAKGTFEARLKRVGDIFVSASLLIITSPLVLISALLIKLGDRGPIFYSQIRTGLNGIPSEFFSYVPCVLMLNIT